MSESTYLKVFTLLAPSEPLKRSNYPETSLGGRLYAVIFHDYAASVLFALCET